MVKSTIRLEGKMIQDSLIWSIHRFEGNFSENWKIPRTAWGCFLEFGHMTSSAESVVFPNIWRNFSPQFKQVLENSDETLKKRCE